MRRAAVCALVSLSACAPISEFELRKPESMPFTVKFPTSRFELPNGVAGRFMEDESAGAVEVDVRYAVGSRDDPPGKRGLARLVALLVDAARPRAMVEGVATSEDATHLRALGRREAFDELMAMGAAPLTGGCAAITQQALDRVREDLKTEIRDRDATRPLARVLELLYPEGHPYGHVPAGAVADLDGVTLADVCRFMSERYVTANAFVVIAGNVGRDEVNASLGRWFAPVPPRSPVARPPLPPLIPGVRELRIELDVEKPMLIAAWPAPPRHGTDGFATALGVLLVDNPYLGRWPAGSDGQAPGETSTIGGEEAPFAVYAASAADAGGLERARSRIERAVDTIDRFQASQRTLGAFRSVEVMSIVTGLESVIDRAAQVADWHQFIGAETELADLFARVSQRTDGALREAMAHTFQLTNVTWIYVTPRRERPESPPYADVGWADGDLPAAAGAVDGIELPERPSRLAGETRFMLDNGLEVHLLPLAAHVPLVWAQLSLGAGSAREPAGSEGLAAITSGAAHARALNNVSNFTLTARTLVTPDETSFSLGGLSMHLDVILATLAGRVLDPDYRYVRPRDDYFTDEERARLEAEIAARRAVRGALHGSDHPYASTGAASVPVMQDLYIDDVVAFAKRHYGARQGKLVIVGDFDPAQARTEVRRRFANMKAGEEEPQLPPVTPPTHAVHIGAATRPTRAVPLYLAWPVPAAIDAQYPVRLVLAEVLAERMRRVRARLGASFELTAELETRVAAGAVVVTVHVDARRAAEVLRALRADVAELRAEGLAPDDFTRARGEVLARLVRETMTSAGLAARLAWLVRRSLPVAFADTVLRRLATLNASDIASAITVDLAPEREIVTLAGPAEFLRATFTAAGIRDARIIERP